MRILAGICFFFFLMVSCGDRSTVPADVLSQKEMSKVLTDILLAESFVENFSPIKSNEPRDSAIASEVDKVLAIHKVTKENFMKSYRFYKTRPAFFKLIMDSIYAGNQRYQDKIDHKKPILPAIKLPPQ